MVGQKAGEEGDSLITLLFRAPVPPGVPPALFAHLAAPCISPEDQSVSTWPAQRASRVVYPTYQPGPPGPARYSLRPAPGSCRLGSGASAACPNLALLTSRVAETSSPRNTGPHATLYDPRVRRRRAQGCEFRRHGPSHIGQNREHGEHLEHSLEHQVRQRISIPS